MSLKAPFAVGLARLIGIAEKRKSDNTWQIVLFITSFLNVIRGDREEALLFCSGQALCIAVLPSCEMLALQNR